MSKKFAVTLKTLKEEIPVDQFNNILSVLGVDFNNFEDRIEGLEREYEFIGNLDIYVMHAKKLFQ